MHDIKIPDPDARKKIDFEVKHMTPVEEKQTAGLSEKVKVKFENFVNLIATHDFEEVMKKYASEDVILSTNLFIDLANAHDEEAGRGKKTPIVFIVGIIIGIAITYLLIRF